MQQTMSIIIPTLNEELYIGRILDYLLCHKDSIQFQIIVVDGGSSDQTKWIVRQFPVIYLDSAIANRAVQMNIGANHSTTDLLYFVHADALPPSNFTQLIRNSIEKGYQYGFFRQTFDSPNLLLKINSFCTRFRKTWCRGGDQTLYIKKSFFYRLNAYDESYHIMEEYDLLFRAMKIEPFDVMPAYTLVSARKYSGRSWLQVQLANFKAFRSFQNKMDSRTIKANYIKDLGFSADL